MPEPRHWRRRRPPENVRHGPPTRAASVAEQDKAAGGRSARELVLPDGSTATASILLHMPPKGRRVYAYLRCKKGGRNHRKYIGEATADTRADALRLAWEEVRRRELLKDLLEGARPKEPLARRRVRA
ncbi:MAG: hypothetical protein WD472_02455 [Dehalococcoidia bacterium]